MGSFGKFLQDIPASFVVFLVALPLCMGIAIASGVPPELGLVTGIIGGIVTGLISGAPLQVSGPAAGLTVLVYQVISEYGLVALGPVVFLAGLLQVAAGTARIGQWFRAVNPAIIYGMLSGIGVLILTSQIHIAFDSKPGGAPLQNLILLPQVIKSTFFSENYDKAYAGIVSFVTLALIVGWERYRPAKLKSLPASLISILFVTIVCFVLELPVDYVKVPSSFVDSLNIPTLADWKLLLDSALLTSAFGLAIIASAETLLSASALKKMRYDAEVRYNKELIAQGIGNTLCGLVGVLPMTGVIVRSSANVNANAKSRFSTVLHGIWLLVFVILVPSLLSFIPMAALAAILLYTGAKLVNPAIVKTLANYGRSTVSIYFITVIGIVLTDLLSGVLIGIAVSLVRLLMLFSNLRIKVKTDEDGVVHVRLKGAATFLTLPRLASELEQIPLKAKVSIEFNRIFYIDYACMDLILSQVELRKRAGGEMNIDSSRLHFAWRKSERGLINLPKSDRDLAKATNAALL
ncbi:MAG: SulP family inorganic anion transporter [Bdellovibrionota bacterium]